MGIKEAGSGRATYAAAFYQSRKHFAPLQLKDSGYAF